jgi:hypothetical protein
MKLKSLLLGLALVAAIVTTAFAAIVMTAFVATGRPNNSATPFVKTGNENEPVTLSANGSLSSFNKENVETDVSGGYVVEDVPGVENGNPLEFWEIKEYEKWMKQQHAENQKLADSGDKSFYEKDADGDYVCRKWTQKDVDDLYAEWQEQLDLMKQGYRFTKPIINSENGSLVGVFDSESSPTTAAGSTIVTMPDGSTVNLGQFETVEEAKKAVEEYLKQQVTKGVLTQREADTILANGSVE